MYRILKIRRLSPDVNEYVVEAPLVAKRAKPGQFVILMTDERGERVPFTIADSDPEKGSVTVIVQTVGATTYKLSQKKEGESLFAFAGPLGKPTDLDGEDKILLVGGGIGAAVIYPQAKHRAKIGKKADVILGARTEELLLYREEFGKVADKFVVMTDDGSAGGKGFVTDAEREMLGKENYDAVFAVGPLPMMRAVCKVAEEFGVRTVISMNSIMVDGTGMCGCCRLKVDGKTLYACVDGPEFDGSKVDFDEAIKRSRTYHECEKECYLRAKEEK